MGNGKGSGGDRGRGGSKPEAAGVQTPAWDRMVERLDMAELIRQVRRGNALLEEIADLLRGGRLVVKDGGRKQ